MSGTYTNTDGRSDSLNAGAAHDTGLYDPARHDNQIVGLYETNAQAAAARDALLAAGIASSAIQLVDRSNTGQGTVEHGGTDEGFWGAVKSLFAPEEDVTAYHHAVDRGHAMVVVTPSQGVDRSRVIEVLEGTNPIDFDAKLEEWRQAGYDYSSRPGAAAAAGMGAASLGMATPAAVPATSGTAGMAKGSVATNTGTRAPKTTGAVPSTGMDNTDTIKVVEERLRVGKREVAAGAVRIRSYVVERPVEEQVRLHQERVSIERHPVDRPVVPGDVGAFQERTIEARATAEEAVVSKEARVVEEVGIRKEASDRTETVRDTVRRTEVEVEDTTGKASPGTTSKGSTSKGSTSTGTTSTGTMSTGGKTPNATPGATTSGMNAPRK